MGCGLKLAEQLGTHPGTGAGLIILTSAMPEPRGGGDLDMDENWHGIERKIPPHNITPGPMPEGYTEIAKRTIGRWAGDRIAIVGDYAEDSDLLPEFEASKIYGKCRAETKKVFNNKPDGASYSISKNATINGKPDPNAGKYVHYVEVKPPEFKDISDDVAKVIEHELRGKFEGDGWRDFKSDGE